MELQLFQTLWGHTGTLAAAVADARKHGFDGLEGQVPFDTTARRHLKRLLDDDGLHFIAEITTAGSYVPDRNASMNTHLTSLRCHADAAADMHPLFLTVVAGCDAWSVAESVEFFGSAMGIAADLGFIASFETHRARSLFNPWVTRDILRQLPGLKLTCDFSHWCVVCERLVMDTESDVLALCLKQAHHVHARVGYDQGPQVPHPAAPEHYEALKSHERWWTQIWEAHSAQGRSHTTMTPEFGPDGYLHTLPFTGVPVANLNEINRWMAQRQQSRFANRATTRPPLAAAAAA